MNELTKAFVEEYKKDLEYKKNNGPIDMNVDDLWKYSGEIEKTNKDLEEYDTHFAKYYKKRINNRNIYLLLNATESKIIDYFYKTSDKKTIDEMAKDLNICPSKIRQIISKHLKIMKDDKNNTG